MSSSCGFKGIAILNTQAFDKLVQVCTDPSLDVENQDGFSLFFYLLGVGNQYYEGHFNAQNNKYFELNHELKAVRFATSMNQEYQNNFINELNNISSSIVMLGITEFDERDLESAYLKNAAPITVSYPDDIEAFYLPMELTHDGIYRLINDPMASNSCYGCPIDEEPSFKQTHDLHWLHIN